jgi:chromosome segregation ATPase
LTTVDALTAAQGELAQTRAELGRMAKAAAEARTRLSVIELNLSRLREENDRLRLDNKALEVELNAALAAAPQS